MPTAYTSAIQEGADFKQFAQLCARAFGATIMQRDDSLSAPLKTVVKPSPYYKKALKKAKIDLSNYAHNTHEQWQALLDLEYNLESDRHIAGAKKEKETLAQYQSVLEKAKGWTPPTDEHTEIKLFMIKQIEDSISWDCNWYTKKEMPGKQNLEVFKSQMIDKAKRDIEYHAAENKKEIERAKDRTNWLTSFVNSL